MIQFLFYSLLAGIVAIVVIFGNYVLTMEDDPTPVKNKLIDLFIGLCVVIFVIVAWLTVMILFVDFN